MNYDELVPKPFEVLIRGHEDTPVGYACPTCGAVFSPRSFHDRTDALELTARHASEHCAQVCACGARSASSPCANCRSKALAITEKERFLRAKKVSHEGYQGPLYCPELAGEGQGYFVDLAALRERYSAADIPPPHYAWACETLTFHLDAQQVLAAALQAHHNGATGALSPESVAELQGALDRWCATQPVIQTYEPDYSRAVVLRDVDARAPAA